MNSLVICRDGILRQREGYHDAEKDAHFLYELPVRTLQPIIGQNLILAGLHSPAIIEDGLTVRELFRNFVPWADTMEALAEMDFKAFADEAERPGTTPEEWTEFSHIEVYGTMDLSPVPKYERVPPNKDAKFFAERLGMGAPVITDRLQTDIMWGNIGRIIEPKYDEHGCYIDGYSLDYSPINEWAHLPLKILDRIKISDGTVASSSKFLTTDVPLLNPNHPWVKSVSSACDEYKMYSVEVEYTASFYEAVIMGCLYQWGFHYSPAQRDEVRESVTTQIEELDQWIDEHGRPDDTDIVGPEVDGDDSEREHRNRRAKQIIWSVMAADDAVRLVTPTEDD